MLCLVAALLCVSSAWGLRTLSTARPSVTLLRMGRIARPEGREGRLVGAEGDSASDDEEQDMVTLPFDGLVGKDKGLFNKALDVMDPIDAAYAALPGEEGSQERKDAMDALIKSRVDALKSSGALEDTRQMEQNPLANVPKWKIALSTLAVCRPFEDASDLALTFILSNSLTVAFAFYVLGINGVFRPLLTWFVETDFAGSNVGSLLKL